MAINDFHQLPWILKHTTIAIFGKLGGSAEYRIINAYNIARGKLAQQGYLSPGSIEGPPTAVGLTPQGVERNKKHKQEHDGKSKQFDSMAWILNQVELASETLGTHKATNVPENRVNAALQLDAIARKRNVIQRTPDHTPPPGSKSLDHKVMKPRADKAARAKRANTPTAKRARKA